MPPSIEFHNCTKIHYCNKLGRARRFFFFNSATLNVQIVLQGNKYIAEFAILLQTSKMHFVNPQSYKCLFTFNITRSLNTTKYAVKRTQCEETDFSAANDDVLVDVKNERTYISIIQ